MKTVQKFFNQFLDWKKAQKKNGKWKVVNDPIILVSSSFDTFLSISLLELWKKGKKRRERERVEESQAPIFGTMQL